MESPPRHIRTEWRVCRQTYSPGEKAGEGRPLSAQSGEEVVRMYDGLSLLRHIGPQE